MAETKFTPGPWEFEPFQVSGFEPRYRVNVPDGKFYLETGRGLENKANAHLIAAAPEMYAELERALQYLPNPIHAIKLLAKARGES